MSIRLLRNINNVGVANDTVTLNPAIEAGLVSANNAVYTSGPDIGDSSVPVHARTTLTGGIKKIESSGQQIMSAPSVRVAGSRVLTRNGSKLECDGVEVRELGVCAYDYLINHLGGTNQDFLTEFPLIAQAGFRFVRLMGGPLWPNGWTNTYGTNEAQYFARIKQVLDCARDNGIGIVLSLFWRHATQADLAGERVNAGLGTDGSATRARCATIIQKYAQRFSDHPAFAAWEVGNEYSLFAANGSLPTANAGNGTPASYSSPDDVLTLASMRSFYEFFATTVRANDTTGRLILTGNGGPGGVIEKSLSNYLSIVPLDNPGQIDTISIHKYSRNEFGNRAYADLTDTLVALRKLGKTAGKPFVLGEFGMERNETYGGYGGDAVFEAGCQAVYRSGVSLSFAWNWQQDTGTGSNNFNFHPLNTANGTNTKFEILRRYNNLMRLDGPVGVDDVAETQPQLRGGQAVEVPGAGNACLLTVADNAALKPAGVAVAFWVKLTKDGLQNRRIARKYGGNAGWYVGLDGNSPACVTFQVQYTDGTTQNLGGQAHRKMVEDGWHHYIFQLNTATGQATTGLTVFEDGRWVKTLTPTAGKTWAPSADALLFFGDVGPASVSYVGLKDFRLLNRALTDVEARNLYLYDVLPASTLAEEWKFDGNYNGTNGNNATVSAGSPAFETFPL